MRALRGHAIALFSAACVASVPSTAHAEPPPGATSWNQLGEPARSGLSQGATTLGVSLALVAPAELRTVRLGFSFEHLLRDRWGVVGGVAAPFAGVLFAPLQLGVRFHALARSPLDPYATVTGGVALTHPNGEEPTLEPFFGANAGLAFHYWGFAFLAADLGFEHATYSSAASGRIRGLSTYVASLRTGVTF